MTKLTILTEKFENHAKEYKAEIDRIHETMRTVITAIDGIKENHLVHLKEEMNCLSTKITKIDTNLKWTMRIGGVILIETFGVLLKLLII